jgi:hypothetical protein
MAQSQTFFVIQNFTLWKKLFLVYQRSPKDLCLSEKGGLVTYVMNLQGLFTLGKLIVWGAK